MNSLLTFENVVFQYLQFSLLQRYALSIWSLSLILRLGPVVLLSDSNPSLLRTVPVLVMNVLCSWNPLNPRQTRMIDSPTCPKGVPPALWGNEWAQGSCGTRLKQVSRWDPFLWKRSWSSLMSLPCEDPGRRWLVCLSTRKWILTRHWMCFQLPELWEINISCL